MYNKLVIGIDQSYARCGISISVDGELKVVSFLSFHQLQSKSSIRIQISEVVEKIILKNKDKAKEIMIVVERIRTFTGPKGSLRPDYIKTTAALIASIVDTAYLHDINVYSVTTKSWKSHVLGTSTIPERHKKEIKPEKMLAVEFIKAKGFDVYDRDDKGNIKKSVRGKNKGQTKYNDDACDSGCISLYPFIPIKKQNLQKEE